MIYRKLVRGADYRALLYYQTVKISSFNLSSATLIPSASSLPLASFVLSAFLACISNYEKVKIKSGGIDGVEFVRSTTINLAHHNAISSCVSFHFQSAKIPRFCPLSLLYPPMKPRCG